MTTPAGGGDVTPASRDAVNERLPSVCGLHRANAAGTTWQAGKTVTPGLTAPRAPELCTGAGRAHPARIRMGVAGLHPWWTRVRDAAPARAQINAAPSRMRFHDHYDHEDEMNNRIDTDLLLAERADQVAHLSDELRNAKALADKLQTLLDSKTHQVEALHAEMANTRRANELLANAANRLQARCEEAESTIDAMLEILRPHAAPVFDEAGTPLDVARYVASKITTDPEPDIDTVPLADLLEAVGTYLEHDQAVTIRGSFEAVHQVEIHALGLTFIVDTREASEALTKLQELGGCLVQEA